MPILEVRNRNKRVEGETDSDEVTPNMIHARNTMGKNKTGTALNKSRGGTPWVGNHGSAVLPANDDLPEYKEVPFDGAVMVNRQSQAVRDLAPQDTLDDLVYKNKKPWWDTGNQLLPKNIGNWTASGPQRPTIRLRTFTWRKGSQGNLNRGLHTNISHSPRTLPGREKMVPGRQNRLTIARFRGQSFSSTTQILGQ